MSASSILIQDAEIDFGRRVDVRMADARIQTIAPAGELTPLPHETRLAAAGATLLPGLHDHHLHLAALAVSLNSIACGPPEIQDAPTLTRQLRRAAAGSTGWLRGFNYHESVAGDIDRDGLDQIIPDRPLRIQHRSGRLWMLNSCALRELKLEQSPPAGLEIRAGRATGRLFEADDWLKRRLAQDFPDLTQVGRLLLAQGITGVTDATPHNDLAQAGHFLRAQHRGELPQDLLLLGDESLAGHCAQLRLRAGALKLHLLESRLPDFEVFVQRIRAAHARQRPVAIHAVSRTELVFALAALQVAAGIAGDRIEHASVTPPDLLAQLQTLQPCAVTQPAFVHARGDHYLQSVEPDDRPWLYRLHAIHAAGLPLAASSDAPFGPLSPWLAMQAAVTRTSSSGAILGADERLTPEAALQLYLAPLDDPTAAPRQIHIGAPADLCLLDRPWAIARADLAAVQIRATFCAGHLFSQE